MTAINPTLTTIRPITPKDAPTLLALEESTQPLPWSLEAFEKCIAIGFPGWIIFQGNVAIGFIMVSIGAQECHILNICVHPHYQGKKFGKTLLTHALLWAKRHAVDMVYLEVRRSNHRAIQLYRKSHFKEIGERKNYYPLVSGYEDAIVFARDIGVEDENDIID